MLIYHGPSKSVPNVSLRDRKSKKLSGFRNFWTKCDDVWNQKTNSSIINLGTQTDPSQIDSASVSPAIMSIPYVRHFFASQFLTLPELTSLSFEGQTVVVTGANTGLGFECARHFHTLGADLVILAVRDVRKGESARDKLLVPGRGAIEVWQLDLSDTASVIAFAEKAANHPRIDVVLENAGMQQHRWQVSKEGFEMTVAVNFYGTILLALLLIPILRRSGQKYKTNPRLTIVTSEVHHFTSWGQKAEPLTDLNDESKFVASDRFATLSSFPIVLILTDL